MPSQNLKNRLKYALAQGSAADELVSLLYGISPFGQAWYVDTFVGADTNSGQSADKAFATMSQALTSAQTGDTVFFKGDVREEIVGSNLKFDITIVGTGSKHHPDQPSSTYDPGASMWRPPASPTTATPLIELRGRGWRFINVTFDCPVDAAGVLITENGLSGTSEYAGSHAQFLDCLFRQGQYGVQLAGAGHNILWDRCEFFLMNNAGETGTGIIQTSTSVALGFKNTVRDCIFAPTSSAGGNDRHIVGAWQSSTIVGNTFGTVEGTGLYLSLSGGNDNMVTRNTFGGVYTTADYVAGTSDSWLGNWVTAVSTQAPNGFTIAAPAA